MKGEGELILFIVVFIPVLAISLVVISLWFGMAVDDFMDYETRCDTIAQELSAINGSQYVNKGKDLCMMTLCNDDGFCYEKGIDFGSKDDPTAGRW